MRTTQPLLDSLLDGHNVNILAYGPPCSGKTFSLEGDHEDPNNTGLILRAVCDLIDEL